MNRIIFSILILVSFLGFSDPVDTGHARISLIKDHSDFVPGTSINIGLKVSMDDGWHTYWKNPGDSGGPIELNWDLPCLLYTSPSPRDLSTSRMPSSA